MLINVQYIGREATGAEYLYTTELTNLKIGDLVIAPVYNEAAVAKVSGFPEARECSFELKEIKQKVIL